jgi:hypothetical protein
MLFVLMIGIFSAVSSATSGFCSSRREPPLLKNSIITVFLDGYNVFTFSSRP